MKALLIVACVGLLLVGCVSGSGEFQWRYREQYTLSQKNRQGLMHLRRDMSPEEVRAVMGEPQMIEGYPRETVWYYRTATPGFESSTAFDTTATERNVRLQELPGSGADSNFTLLVFNDRQRLVAWGRNASLPREYPLESPVLSQP